MLVGETTIVRSTRYKFATVSIRLITEDNTSSVINSLVEPLIHRVNGYTTNVLVCLSASSIDGLPSSISRLLLRILCKLITIRPVQPEVVGSIYPTKAKPNSQPTNPIQLSALAGPVSSFIITSSTNGESLECLFTSTGSAQSLIFNLTVSLFEGKLTESTRISLNIGSANPSRCQ